MPRPFPTIIVHYSRAIIFISILLLLFLSLRGSVHELSILQAKDVKSSPDWSGSKNHQWTAVTTQPPTRNHREEPRVDTSNSPSLIAKKTPPLPVLSSINASDVKHRDIFVYVPDFFLGNGICSQLQAYLLAVQMAASLNRSLMVLEAPQDEHPFGCPENTSAGVPESFNINNSWSPNTTGTAAGLQGLLQVPTIRIQDLNRMCSSAIQRTRHEWVRLPDDSTNDFPLVFCDSQMTFLVDGGKKMRRHFLKQFLPPQAPHNESWVYAHRMELATNLEATPSQLQWFQQLDNVVYKDLFPSQLYQGVAALIAQQGIPWQPWVVDNESSSIRLPHPNSYTAFHVRRGDKLKREAKRMVQMYWESQNQTENHPDYIPLQAFIDKLQVSVDPVDIYIATDDPVTVQQEITQHYKQQTDSSWRIHLLSHDTAGHLNTRRDDCQVQWQMTRDAVSDLQILIHSTVFVGEFNSNWGRFIHTMRTTFSHDRVQEPMVRDFRFVSANTVLRYVGQ